jgi:hypothetical protein
MTSLAPPQSGARQYREPRRRAPAGSSSHLAHQAATPPCILIDQYLLNVPIVPETTRVSDNTSSHRNYLGHAAIGYGWSKRSSDGRDYLWSS